MSPSDFSKADIQSLVDQLSLEEAISLISGVGVWHTHAIPRLGIPAVKVSDGPNGVRGSRLFMSTPAKCLPSATALGATWDTALIRHVGIQLIANEAKLRGASVVLAPTVNIQRSPLGGRSFECFSEDPHLSGNIAAAYIGGIQSEGIGSCIKHFVANDQEDNRFAADSIVSERALREIYLMPFMLAQIKSKPWAYMAGYNRLNGTHCSENVGLLKGILRDDWCSDAMVMSDWFGTHSLSEAIIAGLDLEMPGINNLRTLVYTTRSVAAGKLTLRTIKERAKKVLDFLQKCAHGAPEIVGGAAEERTDDNEEDNAFMRKVASESIVLLKNEDHVLPLNPAALKKVAILGPNAKARVISGGGSANLKPSYVITPYDGIVDALPKGVDVSYSEGATAYQILPSLERELTTTHGQGGWEFSWCNMTLDGNSLESSTLHTQVVDETEIHLLDAQRPADLNPKIWGVRLKGKLRPRPASIKQFEFGLSVSGRAKLYVDGVLLIDNWTKQRAGSTFFGIGTQEETGILDVKPGFSHEVVVEFTNISALRGGDSGNQPIFPGVRLGGRDIIHADSMMESAVQLAKEADVAIVVVGLNGNWETEGRDRTALDLPGRTNELVQKVAAANRKTVIINQSGSAVTMPWIDSVPALVHAWYLGNATGAAIADVIFGKTNPSGKLSLTFPRRLEDVPSYGHFGSKNGKVRYGEDLFVVRFDELFLRDRFELMSEGQGYKHYLHRKIPTLFPFGFGLSYTSFEYSHLSLSSPTSFDHSFTIDLSVEITNTGAVPGSEIVQVYTSFPLTSELTHPPRSLKAFAKVALHPGESRTVDLTLDKYAVSYWNETIQKWVAERGVYTVYVAASSEDVKETATLAIDKEFEWTGL